MAEELHTRGDKTPHSCGHSSSKVQLILHPQLVSSLAGQSSRSSLQPGFHLFKASAAAVDSSQRCQSLQLGNIIFGCVSLPQHRKYNKIKTNRKKVSTPVSGRRGAHKCQCLPHHTVLWSHALQAQHLHLHAVGWQLWGQRRQHGSAALHRLPCGLPHHCCWPWPSQAKRMDTPLVHAMWAATCPRPQRGCWGRAWDHPGL